MSDSFNKNFNDHGEKQRFIYKPNPLLERAYQIFEYFEDKSAYEPVGDYVLLDKEEDPDITEKKLFNLLSIMNGRRNLVDFTNLTNERILYNIVTNTNDSGQQKVIFRTYDGSGISKENAMLTLLRSVFND